MTATEPETARLRQQWLADWLDLDVAAQDEALADPALPPSWREAAARIRDVGLGEGILDRDPQALAEDLIGATTPSPAQGWVVGRYRLDELIGHGGMAVVWSARHQDPQLPQQVAVKFLRAPLSTPEWCGRFLREQRILARLNHPNISRLFDAGVSDNGTPYIVMELIRGRSIVEHCDALELDCRQRVQLFIKVCDAVAYAHRNLIVHRDLKPGNVLVGDDGEPHLLDFGIAKLLDATGADAELTRAGPALLTPAYAAPEQLADGDITTATDVYGLGALLHELLTGARSLHHPDGRLQRPSGRVESSAVPPRALASTRALSALLRGDLDAILERALRREPELRYASAHEFGEDLERWLQQVPVQARAGSFSYRANKFVRRHWLAMSLALITLLGLAMATAISWRASHRADRAAEAAVQEAQRARNSRDFVLELMTNLSPGTGVRTRERLLDRAAELIRERFADDHPTRIEMLLVLGEIERGYGRLAESQRLLEAASASALALQGEQSALWLEAEASLAHTYFRRGDYRTGRDRLDAALRAYDALGGPNGAARIRALTNLGQLQAPLDEIDNALRLQEEANALADRLLAANDPLRQSVKELYGEVLASHGRIDDAKRVLRENVELLRARLGDQNLPVVSALETLALREIESDQPETALSLLREAKRIAAEVLDGPHVIAAYVENSLGVAESRLGHSLAAQQAHARALAIFEALPAPPPRMLAASEANLGEAALELQDYASASLAFEQAATHLDALSVDTPTQAFGPRCLGAEAYARNGQHELASERIGACIEALRMRATPDADFLAIALAIRADAQWRAGQSEAARASAIESRGLNADIALHEAMLPLLVLAELDHAASDQVAVRAHAQEALKLGEAATWARPCATSRQLARLAELAHTPGLEEPSGRLRKLAGRVSCTQ